ncbi:MAG: nucleotidyltransferase domain-containing protein [Sulfurovum sp.]|nr:nucleotidyltransferase domain-containing protein [Sulfurovum sp.]
MLSYLKKLKSEFQDLGIESLVLFGGFACGTQNIYSDIDIAIKKEKDYLKIRPPYKYFETLSNPNLR